MTRSFVYKCIQHIVDQYCSLMCVCVFHLRYTRRNVMENRTMNKCTYNKAAYYIEEGKMDNIIEVSGGRSIWEARHAHAETSTLRNWTWIYINISVPYNGKCGRRITKENCDIDSHAYSLATCLNSYTPTIETSLWGEAQEPNANIDCFLSKMKGKWHLIRVRRTDLHETAYTCWGEQIYFVLHKADTLCIP